MRRLLIVRHGQSIWNLESKFTGWTNIPLNRTGKIQALNIGKKILSEDLKPSVIYSSILQRSIDTSKFINNNFDNRLDILTDWRLNEKHYGTLEGVKREFIRDKYGKEFTRKMRSDFTMMPPIISETVKNKFKIVNMCDDAKKYFNNINLGESKKDVYNRTIPFYLDKIIPSINNNHFPLIVTHKHTARVLLKYLCSISDKDFENYKLIENKIIYIELDENMKKNNLELIDY